MPRIRFHGPKCEFTGKTLFEILLNLKNFGVGRMVLRNSWKYPEPCYFIIKKVDPQMDSENQWGEALVDFIFRGNRQPPLIVKDGNWPDFRLIPKDEEHLYLNSNLKETVRVYDREREFPPLLARILQKEQKLHVPPKLLCTPLSVFNTSTSRLANEGEKPTHYFKSKPNLKAEFLEGVKPI